MNYLQRRIKLAKKSKKILFILSIILFLGVISINKNKMYQLKNETYYEVTLNPNNYFPCDKLEPNNYYLANSIKNIDLYFDYYLKNKSKENINYSYDITATIKSYADNGTKLIWTKNFNLKKMNNLNAKEIKINENYKLDYQYYVDYVKSFQEYFNIKTENYLDIKLNIKIDDKDNSDVLVTIPISGNIIEITMKEENNFLENNNQNTNLKKVIIFIILSIITIYIISKILFNKNSEKTILKAYQDIIITIQNKPNIAVNNNSNIFNYQNDYYIIIGNIYYIYNLKKT